MSSDSRPIDYAARAAAHRRDDAAALADMLDLMVTVDRYGMAHIPAHALREKLAVLLASVGGMR
jgi:hypothetical protein